MDHSKADELKAAKLAKITADEDLVRSIIDGWTEERRACAYSYLFRTGMNIHKAQEIRRKWGIDG